MTLVSILRENIATLLTFQSLLVFVVVFLTLLWLRSVISGPKFQDLPPGPWNFPLVGAFPYLGTKPHEALFKMRETYGDVIFLYFGIRPVLVLNSCEATKEAFVKHGNAFSGRPHLLDEDRTHFDKHLTKCCAVYHPWTQKCQISDIGPGKVHVTELDEKFPGGIVFSEGAKWQEQRRFSLSCLRDFGFGRASLEGKIAEEVDVMLEEIGKSEGRPVDVAAMLEISIANVICSIVFGNRYDHEDEEFRELLHTMHDSKKGFAKNNTIATFMPFLKQLPPFKGWLIELSDVISRKLWRHWWRQIISHRESFDPDNIRDFIDAYLLAIQQNKNKNPDTTLSEVALVNVIDDLFGAGTDTTNTTLNWGMLYMLHHPHVQNKVQKELDAVVGHGKLPNLSDRPNLPYTEATIMEIQRMANIVPLGVFHKTTEDSKLYDYKIPKDTTVFCNLYAVHLDPKHWENPTNFDPQRFLDSQGKVIAKPESFMPFSIGKRICMGESLAKMELFLFFASLLHRFTFSATTDKLPSLEGDLGIVLSPKHRYRVSAHER